MPFIQIAFPIPTRQLFTYRIPSQFKDDLKIGCRVHAPFGRRNALGYAVEFIEQPDSQIKSIKAIAEVIDPEPLFNPELFSFLKWTADYYLASIGETCAAAYPFSPLLKPKRLRAICLDADIKRSARIPDEIKHEKQRLVIQFLIKQPDYLSVADVTTQVGVSPSTIKTLESKGILKLEPHEFQRSPFKPIEQMDSGKLELSDEQDDALMVIENAMAQNRSKPIMLHGVTGSGKTEVYLQAIEKCLQAEKTALVLIPEISLTPQTMDRFRNRFGDEVGILHSALGKGERFDEWRLTRQGKRRIVLGTRSAIFAPLTHLGLVIVDEEHDGSYKQSDPSPRYNARDLAAVRAHQSNALCLLGSATPATETSFNANQGKYDVIHLKKRIAKHGLPKVALVDMRGRSEEEEILSNELKEALLKCISQKHQAILFLNRRGFATSSSCKECGHILSCDHCSVALVYHRSVNQLLCHHCDYRIAMPEECPSCAKDFIRQRGFGTERVAEAVEKLLPNARISRIDKDTIKRKGDHERLLTPFRQGEIDVLVGTQMIAKGLDFPNVTLVGVINADYSLSLPDFRAAERTFFLLTQVAGRAGRGEHPGHVYIQTFCPDHYSIQYAIHQNYNAFYNHEIKYRRMISFPPFSRLVLWRIEAADESIARGQAWELYSILNQRLSECSGVQLLPPVEAPLYRLRDYFRWQVTLKSPDHLTFRPMLQNPELLKFMSRRIKNMRIVQDVDPYDML